MNYAWQLDRFDTEIFGFNIAKITNIAVLQKTSELPALIEKLKKELTANNIVYATYRVSAKAFPLIHVMEKAGFVLVDGLISLEKTVTKEDSEKIANIRQAVDADSQKLQQIAGKSFIANRFFHDDVFANYKKQIQQFYAKWIENCLQGEAAEMVLVWEKRKQIYGFIALQKKGHIPLLAVSKNVRGKGISRSLIKASFAVFERWGVDSIKIETVMTNIPALRAYEACGFRIIDSHVTLRWYKNG